MQHIIKMQFKDNFKLLQMKDLRYLTSVYVFASFVIFLNSCAENKGDKMGIQGNNINSFYIGWASGDITPDKSVLLQGQFHARVSEGIDMNWRRYNFAVVAAIFQHHVRFREGHTEQCLLAL